MKIGINLFQERFTVLLMSTFERYHIIFYNQPMYKIYIETAVLFVVWTVFVLLLPKRARRIAGCTGSVLSVLLILLFTVFGRQQSNVYGVNIIPFSSFTVTDSQTEFYRSMYLNILLFMPLGMTLPFALPDKLRLKPLIAIGSGLALSVAVEFCQLIFNIGKFEIDDMIKNTVGICTGVLSYLIVWLIRIRKQK